MSRVFARFDISGFPQGFWVESAYLNHDDEVIEGAIPSDTIEISAEQHIELLMHQGLRRWDGFNVVPYDPPSAPLSDIKTALKAQVDAAAERERTRYITPGSGQAMTYQAKADEARRLAADPSPDAADYPLLSAEVGITAPDLASVGAVVLAAYQAWQGIGAAIEGARLGTKQAIDLAEDEAAARAAAEVVWPG